MDLLSEFPGLPGLFLSTIFSGSLRYVIQVSIIKMSMVALLITVSMTKLSIISIELMKGSMNPVSIISEILLQCKRFQCKRLLCK